MSGRFRMPNGYDPQMNVEALTTLSRTASRQNTNDRLNGKETPSATMSTDSSSPRRTPVHLRKHFVFTDPVAFRYLEEDASTVVIERRGKLEGYEVFLVEQWACSRTHPTFIITTYTGDKNHTVVVGILGVPADENLWSPRMRVYFKAISQYHARARETPLGTLMITNLSSFPSALTVIPVPGGDIRKYREDFIVNEDLKRLGCSGRSGMSLSTPSGATQAKFQQLYRTSDRIPLYGAVMELVKLCQVALMIFGKLQQEYVDGCLCDITEKAINDWWTEIGCEHYNAEPTDGILGPSTVAGILGLLMGARNRLNYLGEPVSKDAFDVYSLKRGIAHFQKSQKLERTRRLDRHTLNRLHRVTAKAAAGEGWAVPKAVKSTVVELGGKGGEMVMGLVGRDKDGIGDIETLDLDTFITLVHGERAKWLWYGKPRRSVYNEENTNGNEFNDLSFSKDDQGSYVWSHSRYDSLPPDDDVEAHRREKEASPAATHPSRSLGWTPNIPESPSDRDYQLRKAVFKSVTGKMENARSGFGRIKDAVGLRGHMSKQSKEDGRESTHFSPGSSIVGLSSGTPSSPALVNKAFTWKETPAQYHNGAPKNSTGAVSRPVSSGNEVDIESSEPEIAKDIPTIALPDEASVVTDAEAKWIEQVKAIRKDIVTNDPSVAGSFGDLEGPLIGAERDPRSSQILLHRRNSIAGYASSVIIGRNEAWWPRQMSFGDASEAVLGWDPIFDHIESEEGVDNLTTWKQQRFVEEDMKRQFDKIIDLQSFVSPWVEDKIQSINRLDEQYAEDQDNFSALYHQLTEQYQLIKQNSQDILAGEKSHITDAIKDIEVAGAKLEYEINTLVSKVQDVEDGVNQFERQVADLESRATDLETQLMTESWLHWIVRSVTGLGTRPITANSGRSHSSVN